MPVRKAIAENDGVYFITFTCTNWLPLFKICNAYDAVYNWFNYLKQQGHYIIGYVIMPSHVHIIIAFSLQQQNSHLILSELSSTLNNTEIKEGKLHNVFETSYCKYF